MTLGSRILKAHPAKLVSASFVSVITAGLLVRKTLVESHPRIIVVVLSLVMVG